MAKKVILYDLQELSREDTPNGIYLRTTPTTELKIEVEGETTIIYLALGNKFDVIDGRIVIHGEADLPTYHHLAYGGEIQIKK